MTFTPPLTNAEIFRRAHEYAADFQANARLPLHERKHKNYREAFAFGLRTYFEVARRERAELARIAAGLPKIIREGTFAYRELATDGRIIVDGVICANVDKAMERIAELDA